MLDSLDKSAKEAGAVNTVTRTKNGLVGHNTDGEGAIRALEAYGFESMGRRILVIGSGGAAQALVHKLATRKNTIKVLNRTINNARKLVETVASQSEISYEQLGKQSFQKSLEETDLLVNATPLTTTSLLSQYNISLDHRKDLPWVFDLAYDNPEGPVPPSTNTVSPLEMLLQQAALSYEIWIKNKAPLSLMRSSLVDYLGKDWK